MSSQSAVEAPLQPDDAGPQVPPGQPVLPPIQPAVPP